MTIVGDGPERGALEQRIRAAELPVTLRPTLPHDALLALFGQHDVFVLTSAFEGLPLALLEAMAHGCVPVVADVASGIPELIAAGANGFRVPVGDVAGFAEAIASLAAVPEMRRTMSEAARSAIERGYTTALMAARYVELFESLDRRSFVRPRPTLAERAHAAAATTYRSLRAWGRWMLAAEEQP